MSLYKTKAIVLKSIRYKEADNILTILSPSGKISAIAKGSRKSKSRFAGHLEIFSFVELMLYKGKNLHTITQADLVRPNKGIRENYSKFLIASAAVDLVNKVTFDGQEEKSIFTLLAKMLNCINRAKKINNTILVYFDWQIIKELGFLPNFAGFSGGKGVWLDLTEGSFKDYRPNNNNLKLNSLTIEALKGIIKASFDDLKSIKIDSDVLKRVIKITDRYINYQLQTKLKSRSYIE